jgi:hypothetical protein
MLTACPGMPRSRPCPSDHTGCTSLRIQLPIWQDASIQSYDSPDGRPVPLIRGAAGHRQDKPRSRARPCCQNPAKRFYGRCHSRAGSRRELNLDGQEPAASLDYEVQLPTNRGPPEVDLWEKMPGYAHASVPGLWKQSCSGQACRTRAHKRRRSLANSRALMTWIMCRKRKVKWRRLSVTTILAPDKRAISAMCAS